MNLAADEIRCMLTCFVALCDGVTLVFHIPGPINNANPGGIRTGRTARSTFQKDPRHLQETSKKGPVARVPRLANPSPPVSPEGVVAVMGLGGLGQRWGFYLQLNMSAPSEIHPRGRKFDFE